MFVAYGKTSAHQLLKILYKDTRSRNLSSFIMSNPMFPLGNVSLADSDPDVADLIEREKNRQWRGLELIASEVSFATCGCMCLRGSLLAGSVCVATALQDRASGNEERSSSVGRGTSGCLLRTSLHFLKDCTQSDVALASCKTRAGLGVTVFCIAGADV